MNRYINGDQNALTASSSLWRRANDYALRQDRPLAMADARRISIRRISIRLIISANIVPAECQQNGRQTLRADRQSELSGLT